MIRFYQRAMHNRLGPNAESRDLALGPELSVLAPLVLLIIALGVYPNFILHRTERSTTSKLQATQAVRHTQVGGIR
jgi:NADH:ubiquinone oxidoreductase subunit 4 (subunit M)